jgi:hypothetical protein
MERYVEWINSISDYFQEVIDGKYHLFQANSLPYKDDFISMMTIDINNFEMPLNDHMNYLSLTKEQILRKKEDYMNDHAWGIFAWMGSEWGKSSKRCSLFVMVERLVNAQEGEISHYGELCLGVLTGNEDVDLDLYFTQRYEKNLDIEDKLFRREISKNSYDWLLQYVPIPTESMSFTKVFFKCRKGIIRKVVYAILSSDFRCKLREFSFELFHESPRFLSSGGIEDFHNEYTLVPNRQIKKEREAMKKTEIYKEELMAKTWEPERVVDWCFSYDERKEFRNRWNI